MSIREKLSPWRTSILLLLLGMISIALGVLQLNSIGNGTTNSTYTETPLPIVIHIVFGIFFNLLSPLQFAEPIRRKTPGFHRILGRLLAVSAIPVVLSALWMNQFFPSYGGALKYAGIVAYNLLLITSLVIAIYAIAQKNIIRHKLWMMRAMAAALGPATQRLIILPIFMLFGQEILTDLIIGILIWAGLIVNLLFVEYIHRKSAKEKMRKNVGILSKSLAKTH
ncbi:DUF2306 domain-containing protein [Thalassotalea sediminis]|uniref:DUF2306 domain-containing protein n=1 Tax=Thalassotalea sediminis TaxID=1759089 RepID=UPI002573FF03|nr:DUF2306 domain-containing protein [Thalassotalea sediminis]